MKPIGIDDFINIRFIISELESIINHDNAIDASIFVDAEAEDDYVNIKKRKRGNFLQIRMRII